MVLFEKNSVVQVRRCLEETADTINEFIESIIDNFGMKEAYKEGRGCEIQYRGIGLKGDFHEDIHRSDDEIIYILMDDKAVGMAVIRRTEFNNAEITLITTEERFKEKANDQTGIL